MPEILRTPIEPAYYRAVPNRRFVAGGSTTSFLEMPYNYLIGGFEYSKELLASVRNGYFGLYTDTESLALSDYATAQQNSPNASMLNANMIHAGLLGYFGGQFQVVSSLNAYSDEVVLKNRAVVGGTIGRRARPMSVIRDTNDSSIVYAVISGPNKNQFFGMAKINTTTRETVWRHTTTENTTAIDSSYATTNPAPGLFGWTFLPVEYLYQDATSLYFLYAWPRNRNFGSSPSALCIYGVNKNSGAVTEISTFNIYTAGVTNISASGWIGYKFLGFTDQHTFLIELQQISGQTESSYLASQAVRPVYDQGCLYKALVAFDLNDFHATVLWSSKPLVPPISNATGSGTDYKYYTALYPLTGSLLIPELDDSVFIPMACQAVWQNAIVESVAQVYMNQDHTEVLDSKILPVVGPYGSWQTVSVGGTISTGFTPLNVDNYTYPLYSCNYSYGSFFVPTANTIPYIESQIDRFNNMLEGEGMTAATDMGKRDALPISRPRFSSYDHLVTKRIEPVLRIHALSPEGKPKKTILPCGEDIIGQGYTAGNYDGTQMTATQFRYSGSSGVAHPWGVIVSHEGFTKVGESSYFYSMVNCFGLTPRSQGYPVVYTDNTATVHPDWNYGYVYWRGTLPGCSYTLRRSGPNLQDCAIYLNGDIFPIYAVSYSINPHPSHRDAAPISWYVEAHDVATDTWIEVDRQENVALSYPPRFVRGDYCAAGLYTLNQSNGCAEYKQYRNYFILKDMRVKCPQGAHAFRITFTDSANGTDIVVGSWMIQEEPWPWKQAQVPEATHLYSGSKPAYSYGAAGISSATNGVYASSPKSIQCFNSSTSYFPIPPACLSIVGPRTCAHVPPCYNENQDSTTLPYFNNGIYMYSNASALSNALYMSLNFSQAIEVIGLQFTMLGIRVTPSSGTGSGVPSSVIITASVDNSNWDTIATIPLNHLPGLESSYVSPTPVWSKTYLYEFDAPRTYRFFRATCGGSAVGSGSSSAKRMWTVQNFSAIQKRNPEFAKTAMPMQSVLDKHYFANSKSTLWSYTTTAMFDDPSRWISSGFWDPWLTHDPATYGETPTGFTWGGFDAHGTLNCGYFASGYLPSNGTLTQDVICSAGYITQDKSVTLMASWKGMLSRSANLGLDGERPLADYANGTFTGEDQQFRKAVYADRVKIVAYSFIRSNYKAATLGLPYRWKVYGSVDGQTWTLIDEKEKTTWMSTETVVEFTVDTPDWYVYYKWEFLETSDGGLNLLSIDTFITGVDEECPYIHTIVPRNGMVKYSSNAEVESGTIIRGLFTHDHVAWTGISKAVSLLYSDSDRVDIIVDQVVPLYTQSMVIALNPSMEDDELPKHIKIEGSTDKETWATVYEAQDLTWDMQDLYRKRVMLSTPGIYRYFRVIFYKPTIPWTELTEYWLLNTKAVSLTSSTQSDQSLFKIKSGEALVHTASDVYAPVANLWLSDSSLATVHSQSIVVRKLNPLSQKMEITRTLAAPNNNSILGSVLDSGKNIWYWTNTASNIASAHNPVEVTGEPDGYCALCVHSSFSAETVHVKFQASAVEYDGTPMLLKLSTWVENPMAEDADKRVSREVKLTLTGGSAKFVSNGEDTITVTTTAGADTELEFRASGPDRVSVVATLLR